MARILSTTNATEQVVSIIERTTHRVTKWKDANMKKRWCAAGMLEAERSFHRLHGYKQLPTLVEALKTRTAVTHATADEYTQTAA